LQYLIRLFPYSDGAKRLQGGKFDLADRLFNSIGDSWTITTTDLSDVRELIPEFFYLPEIFLNSDGLDLGVTQKGRRVDNVVLPPWASSAYDFVRKNRAALESDIVSANLHNWIDLIFGYKQTGK
jgi:hypothetical protein